MNGFTGSTLLMSSIRNLIVDHIFDFLKGCFQPSLFDFYWKSGDFYKILGSVMKWDTSEIDYPKYGNELFNYFTRTLNNLFKNFPIPFAESYAPLKSLCAFLIWSHIFNLVYLPLIFRFTCFTYQMSQEISYLYICHQSYLL